jgi:UDP-glucose-4-epimerase GalE
MRVLVTGGAGYVGSHAVQALLEAGHEVRVLDDLSRGHRQAIPDGVPLVEGRVGDVAACERALAGVEGVLHFAALMSVAESMREPAAYWRVNVGEGLALLDAMARQRVRRIVFSSTCAVYGVPLHTPIAEDHPQDPISPYGSSKRAFEQALLDHARTGSLRAIALRYFNAAGCDPGGARGEDHRPVEEHLVPLAVDAALGHRPLFTVHGDDYDTPDGTCVRDFIHVSDLARAHVLALAAIDRGDAFQAVNLGSETGHSVRDVVQAVERIAGRKVPLRVGPRRPGDPPRLVASAGRARDTLGFRPALGLDDIVRTTLRWREEHPQGHAAAAATA